MNVTLTQPVDIALQTLRETDRRTVMGWLDRLRDWETDDAVRRRSHKLEAEENVYVLKTGNNLRVFFRLEKDGIVVLDIATKATIQAFGQVAERGRS